MTPTSDPQTLELDRLTTHHAGVTVVQSLTTRIAVGATLKWVRGYAASGTVPDGDRDDLLDGAGELPDMSTNKFDADIGVMAAFGQVRGGLTVRNVTEPDFSTTTGGAVTLKRQTRGGIAYVGVPGLIVAADVDLERAAGSLGEAQDVATGAEAKLFRRVAVRTGFRFNTLGDEPGGHAPVYSLGTTVTTYRSLPRRRPGHARVPGGRPGLGRGCAPRVSVSPPAARSSWLFALLGWLLTLAPARSRAPARGTANRQRPGARRDPDLPIQIRVRWLAQPFNVRLTNSVFLGARMSVRVSPKSFLSANLDKKCQPCRLTISPSGFSLAD